ncbi:hypothetical protein Mlute_02423 [Meiothermus luteus]|jgi:hypothetical protein|uniref:DUF3108 domain-containing protein n=1 Tax=Meiothermus luteus TaxID=2026184 RepID=A0A399EDB0_9DEIN|nr:DUF3108 domain-containing protein [Meiothermus luteus]RIH82634.1 hypothetical protein Mlute_02423 [Meiothermus luteus]RMH57218.1 MAG: DUF3108 domain-containing protein [Deinococcota bacterium]
MREAACWLVVGLGLQALAQGVPWAPGERLVYNLLWQGFGVGRLHLTAEAAERGWHFRLRLEPSGLAQALGYGLEAESLVGPDLFTDHFYQLHSEPFRGNTKLIFRREGDGCSALVIHPDGRETTWKSPHSDVLDQLALIYYLRLHPETRQIKAVDYPRLAQGRLEPLQSGGLLGYRFAREDVLIEAWYRPDTRRTPVRLVFGRDFGRIEAILLENSR